ncbi:hypothetical protein B0A49_09507 [Cryomyces minteri]|uniref:Oxidoreductase AflY n=1 Tax=Cryomyces minteri TaxID=331657 RepID=A0A4U0WJ28_9PEZI|nr:hypothetical protein B0A49_09507 [Cryomyces minteri]
MATPSKVELSLGERLEFYVPGITAESAEKTSELLQENHEKHHIFYNHDRFHNHIAHHLLTIYALGASPAEIQKQYDNNQSYQRPPEPLDGKVVDDMHIPERFKSYLGKEEYYHDFLVFFQKEMEEKGWQNVVKEYVFAGDVRADDMLVRMFAGFLHPIIHLGFGVEFKQPAIIAEALAQAAVHDNWMGPLLLGAEKAAKEKGTTESKTLVQLLDEIRADKKLVKGPRYDDGNKLRDGVVKRVPQEMIHHARQYVVGADELDEKVAEMTNAAAYFTGSAQHPPKAIKLDFFFIHCLNCSIFFSAFIKQSWLAAEHKVRLLEWKGRNDLAMYVSRGSPAPLMEEITNYKPKRPSVDDKDPWRQIIERIDRYEDDGHGAKVIRALAHGQAICEPFEQKENFRIKNDMWLQLGHMAIDSVEGDKPEWVRSCGFDEAWKSVKDRPRAQL